MFPRLPDPQIRASGTGRETPLDLQLFCSSTGRVGINVCCAGLEVSDLFLRALDCLPIDLADLPTRSEVH